MTNQNHENGKSEHESKDITIIVNGREKVVPKTDYDFSQIVELAYDPPPSGDNVTFTLTYRRGHGNKPEGTLTEGETVKLKDGMIFNVTATDKS